MITGIGVDVVDLERFIGLCKNPKFVLKYFKSSARPEALAGGAWTLGAADGTVGQPSLSAAAQSEPRGYSGHWPGDLAGAAGRILIAGCLKL